jgi:hypothetical protein
MLKPSIDKILKLLGFQNINDITTIITEKDFDKIDNELIIEAIKEHDIGKNIITNNNISLDTKLAVINRILQLKYEMIIDTIKIIDNIKIEQKNVYNYYKLELMPAGF